MVRDSSERQLKGDEKQSTVNQQSDIETTYTQNSSWRHSFDLQTFIMSVTLTLTTRVT